MRRRVDGRFHDLWAERWIADIEQHARKGAQDRLLSGMQVFATHHCPELEVCQVLATRVKHRHSARHSDRDLQLTLQYPIIETGGTPPNSGLEAIIIDGDYYYNAFEMLTAVHSWWKRYLQELNEIGPDYQDALSTETAA